MQAKAEAKAKAKKIKVALLKLFTKKTRIQLVTNWRSTGAFRCRKRCYLVLQNPAKNARLNW